MLVSIIIPCFNEEKTIVKIIDKILNVKDIKKEIIIIDDNSTDKTKQLLEKIISKKVHKIIYKDKNQGKGAAIRTGLIHAKGDVIIIQDADLEYNPEEYYKLFFQFQFLNL